MIHIKHIEITVEKLAESNENFLTEILKKILSIIFLHFLIVC